MKNIILLLGIVGALSADIARGDVIYDIFFRVPELGDSLDSEATVAAGRTFVGAEVILRETIVPGGASETSYLALANLNAYAVRVSSGGSDGDFSNLTLNDDGGSPGMANGPMTLNFVALGESLGQPGRSSDDIGNRQREALLGTVDLIAPTTGSTTFTLADNDLLNDGDFTTFLTATGLESLAVQSGGGFFGRSLTLSVTSVPEPSSLSLLGFFVGLGIFRRGRIGLNSPQ